MTIEIGLTNSTTNTQLAPLAALSAHYQHKHMLDPLNQVLIPMKKRTFSTASKLIQIILSILAGCETDWIGQQIASSPRWSPDQVLTSISD